MEEDNFDDNGFAWFNNFQQAKPGTPLYDKGMYRHPTNQLVSAFEADVSSGKLPQVSWLIAPANQSEHASNHPAAGEDLTARLLKVLQNNPEVYDLRLLSFLFLLSYVFFLYSSFCFLSVFFILSSFCFLLSFFIFLFSCFCFVLSVFFLLD